MTGQPIRKILQWIMILSGLFAFQLPLPTTGPSVAYAGGTIKIDDTRSVSIGMGLRSSFNTVEDAAPSGTDRSKDFTLDSFRFYLGGQLHKAVQFEFNTDYDTVPAGSEDIRVLDGVLKFEFNEYVNVWAGRFLPPSDRSNLSGPYFLNSWDFPFVQKYPAVFTGRDDGAALWGQIAGGWFKYQVGAFEGLGDTALGPNQKDNLLWAGRLTLNLWDPEPGYYNSSTYYGAKNVLAVGLVAMTQKDAAGTTATAGDFTGWNADFLLERNLGSLGAGTLEAAYYDYDRDGVDAAVTTPDDAQEGKGYFVVVSDLLPGKFGSGNFQGQLQPLLRYQKFENGGKSTGDHDRVDLALSYIINGHNARITLLYANDDPAGSEPSASIFRIGLQFQI